MCNLINYISIIYNEIILRKKYVIYSFFLFFLWNYNVLKLIFQQKQIKTYLNNTAIIG